MRSTVYTLNPWKHHLLTSYMILGILLAGIHERSCQDHQGKHIAPLLARFKDWSLLLDNDGVASPFRMQNLIYCLFESLLQFKVLRGGCWKKINFERPGFQLNKTDDSHCFVASPWIQHYRSGSKSRVLASCRDNASSEGKTNNLIVKKAIICVSFS